VVVSVGGRGDEDRKRSERSYRTATGTTASSNFHCLNLCYRLMPCQNPVVLMIFLIATVQKIVTEILPPSSGLAFGKDARDLLIECCVEFITLISSEANEISEKESKKTIACEHITKALEQLGFGDYVQDIMEVASEHKEQLKVFPSPSRRAILTDNGSGPREEGKQARAERIVDGTASCDAGGGFSRCSSTTWMIFGSITCICLVA